VRLFTNFNFLGANVMMFMLGVLLFASIVMLPLYLQTLMGYTAEIAGLALSVGGIVLLLEMPVVGQLTSRIQARHLIAAGWLALALAMGYSALGIDLLMSFASVAWLRVIQVVGLGLLFVPRHPCRLHRDACRQEQRRGGSRELYAQHRKQRRHLARDHVDRPARPSPSGLSGVRDGGGQPGVSGSGAGTGRTLGRSRAGVRPCRAAGLRPFVSYPARAGADVGLHRYLLGAGRGCRGHVLPLVPAQTQRAARRRRSGCGVVSP
jgi:hypothetical protein